MLLLLLRFSPLVFFVCGDCVDSANAANLLEIPTIALRAKHDTDVSKTDPTKGAGMKKMMGVGNVWKKEWWEDWEEGEGLRVHGPYDLSDIENFVPPGTQWASAASESHENLTTENHKYK
ncbi:hypothetical protein R3P38DRAFT_2758827 [Favolaschia claudopus]|uniref:Uncharacterized protein n=1 Tax=Favolaschia claudopus TaxID=2862362 RepID=A0AAW0E4F5_9AGAR